MADYNRDLLISSLEALQSATSNTYYEDGEYLIERVECDLETIAACLVSCKEALIDYRYALQEENRKQEDNYED